MRQHYKHYSKEERKRLIMECRQSSLSDYQWCLENDINSSTFYNWVKNLRDIACQKTRMESIPDHQVTPIRQEVVRVNILPKDESTSVIIPNRTATNTESASIELYLNGCSIKIHNNADPVLLSHTINLLRGVL
jgi:transposase-like protein